LSNAALTDIGCEFASAAAHGAISLTNAEAIADFQSRRRWFLFWLLGYVPFGILIVALTLFAGLPQAAGKVYVISWLAAAVVMGWRAMSARCPNCGNLFYCYRNKRYLPAAFFFLHRNCKHCGFSIPKTG
jgi:hypothetical protein